MQTEHHMARMKPRTYVAIVNTPGYLPDGDDEPPTFDTVEAAWWYLYHERCRDEAENPCDLCQDTMTHGVTGDCDDDSETGRELGQAARKGDVGTVYGPTPGYSVTGVDRDLGLAYTVSEVED